MRGRGYRIEEGVVSAADDEDVVGLVGVATGHGVAGVEVGQVDVLRRRRRLLPQMLLSTESDQSQSRTPYDSSPPSRLLTNRKFVNFLPPA